MENLRELVKHLENADNENDIILCLQNIEKSLLIDYFIEVCGIQIEPLWIEGYYFKKPAFADCNSHLREKQKNRFGQLYFHEAGRGGFDICLSQGNNYYLSFLIKAAIANGEYITQTGIYKVLAHTGISEDMCEQAKKVLKQKSTHVETSVLFAERIGLQKPCYKETLLAAVPLDVITKYDFTFARKSLASCAQQYISKYIRVHSQCTKRECEAECRRVFGWLPDVAANTIKEML